MSASTESTWDRASPALHPRQDLIAQFRSQREEILERIWEQVRLVAPYGEMGGSEAASVRWAIGSVFDLRTTCLESGRSRLSIQETSQLQDLGATPSGQGVALDLVIEGFRTGFRFSRREHLSLINEQAEEVQSISDDLIDALLDLYADAQEATGDGYHKDGRPQDRSSVGATRFIESVLEGNATEEGLREECAQLALRKFGAHDRAHAVAIGLSLGLIPDRFPAKAQTQN